MSYKGGDVEDKSEVLPVPRSIPALRALCGEVKGAIAQKRVGAMEALLAELNQARRRVFAEQIQASRERVDMHILQAYASICNEANETFAQGLALLDPASLSRLG